MKYEVLVAGTIIGNYKTEEEAKECLEQAKNSYLSMVHPYDVFIIKKIE